MENCYYTGDEESLGSWADDSKNNTRKEGKAAMSYESSHTRWEGPSLFLLYFMLPKQVAHLHSCPLSVGNSFLLQIQLPLGRIINSI